MTDPLSITAGIIAVCDLASRLVNYLDDVRNASEDIKRFRKELQNTSEILHNLCDLAEKLSSFGIPFPAFNTLRAKEGPLDQFKGILESLTLRLGIGKKGIKRVIRMITWPLGKDVINEMIASLERYKGLFLLALSNDQT
jgi:hypothetical protein